MSLIELSAAEQSRKLAAGEISSVELVQAYLDRIEKYDGSVGAFLRYDTGRAIAAAKEIDKRRAAGETLGPLAGIPVAVKDILAERGQRTSCASKMLEEFHAPYDATVIARLKATDAVLIGRTNMDEFAMGGSTENSAFQTTQNPWNLKCSPGGSSGGAAAAVAADFAPLSIGTDTGGSIRQPAGFCGIVGFKPTYGRVSRFGLVAFASSLDQVGPLARSVEDIALLYSVIAGHDPQDSTSLDKPIEFATPIDKPLEGLKIGVVAEHFAEGLDSEVESAVREAFATYESLGAKLVEVSLPHSKYAVATYYVIAPCEASSNLARYDGVHYGYRSDQAKLAAELAAERAALEEAGERGAAEDLDTPLVRMYRKSRSEAFGPEVKRRIMLGTYALSAGYYDAYYLKALQVRRLIRQDYDKAFAEVDVIAGPVTPTPPFELGSLVDDPLAMYLVDLYTVSANLTGIPALSLPCGASKSGLPIGLQLQAKPLAEETLLRAGHMYQSATDWHTRRPPL
ncbi:Asp-tRNA(Asn)/Glu-tRNA(Gln) amidotransferase subunit GatA [Aeoliella sp. ICT_H6.2]|uniref:Glutamyl-tRNA(Gln) amidotransferase subunit A n=1 Tax=Aeoliella straminimaris TaxID=2954799 RepID=A0A9X2FFG3_9BACT|nr:Asp-tRNA(Asn)/Glu-tRNA(Gln) amidotransferase subunit GatA [Aeoliella straminimaris]MCO6047268.1 Asp-tRNA(Asn)/Glu-tRNA(Gln) amidotransferase subunit GatA [Aeoliella straminimaris]